MKKKLFVIVALLSASWTLFANTISSEDVLSLIEQGKRVDIANKTISGDLDFTLLSQKVETPRRYYTVYVSKDVIFSGCAFTGKITTSGTHNGLPVRIVFKDDVYFEKSFLDGGIDFSGATIFYTFVMNKTEVYGKAIFSNTTFGKADDSYKDNDCSYFRGVVFHKEVSFDNVTSLGTFNFQSAIVNDESIPSAKFKSTLRICNSRIQEDINFYDVSFSQDVIITNTVVSDGLYFSSAYLEQSCVLNNSFFGYLIGKSTVFDGTFSSKNIIVNYRTIFNKATFNDSVTFAGSTFGKADDSYKDNDCSYFRGVVFHKEVSFDNVVSLGTFNFQSKVYDDESIIPSAKFISTSSICNSRFQESIDFYDVSFSQDVIITNTVVSSELSFNNAYLEQSCVLNNSIFGYLYGISTTFNGMFSSKNIIVNYRTSFNKATFNDSVTFAGSTFGKADDSYKNNDCSYFRGVVFHKEVSFDNVVSLGTFHFQSKVYDNESITPSAKFISTSSICNSRFQESIDFYNVSFSQDVIIKNTVVSSYLNFNNAYLEQSCVLDNSILGSLYGKSTAFDGTFSSKNIIVNHKTVFQKATFNDSVSFAGSTFGKADDSYKDNDCSFFGGAIFASTLNFNNTTWLGTLDFVSGEINSRPVGDAKFAVFPSFENAVFKENKIMPE